MTAMKGGGGRRLMHVMQSPTTSIPTSLNVSRLVKSVPQLSALTREEYASTTTSFEVLGGSLLRVGLAPSTALYTKRSSLVGTFGHAVVSTLYLNKVLSRLMALQRPFGFQKIMSASPVCTLVSSMDPLAVLTLDGTIDWVVARSNALHTFSGEQLIVEARRRGVLRKNRPQFSHTFLSGRGTVALSGKGQLYKVSLEPGESFLALKDNLVAYSVDSNNRNIESPRYHHIPYTLEQQQPQQNESASVVSKDLSLLERLKALYQGFATTVRRFVHSESGKFVRIAGPTTLLLQSTVPSYVPDLPGLNLNANPLEGEIQRTARSIVEEENYEEEKKVMAGMPGRPEDHLKIATVSAGKVSLQSTKDFDQFVNQPK
ncbi:hypothetical protein TRICI_003102 [Trichomonascus ciferrii]|uniref:Altered inheritance of mitochondria protein 24, mitochondrial n=1 Tax=Trichomonascus ciferrii TaxID=44093 RepID=A0A642VAZ9_9ASCO|nr:hypothetical protein TRICI_003102 [Trichomonascus ciferrii]